MEGTTSGQLLPIIRANISKEAFIVSDEWKVYGALGKEYWMHQTVNHSIGEYVRGIVVGISSAHQIKSFMAVQGSFPPRGFEFWLVDEGRGSVGHAAATLSIAEPAWDEKTVWAAADWAGPYARIKERSSTRGGHDLLSR